MNGRRIVITGGAGCLGSNLIEHLLPQGDVVLVIDNFATGKRDVVPPVPGLEVVEGSIADRALVDSAFDTFQPTHVIHSAAAYKDPAAWSEDVATNVAGTVVVAQAALRHRVRRFLNFQTALCYGRPSTVPIPVDHPVAPFTSYGISKVAGEQYLRMSGLPLVSLRLANICGPRLAIGPIPTFYKRLRAGQGCFCSDTIRDFLDMSDFIAIVESAMVDDAATGLFNVSTGEGHSIHEVLEAVAGHLGIPVPDAPILPPGSDDVRAVVLDPTETERAFGWSAQTGFVDTIHRQLDWYDQYGVTDVFSHLAPRP